MHVKAKLASYEKLALSVNLTAPVEDWRTMLKQLEGIKNSSGYYGWPASGLVDCISSILSQLDKTHAGTASPADMTDMDR